MMHPDNNPKMKIKTIAFLTALLFLVWRISLEVGNHGIEVSSSDKIDFNFDIKPLLADRCFECHGPDENAREAELRLDRKEGAFGDLGDGYFPIVAGKPEESEMVWRIFAEDEDDRMPPPDSGHSLTLSERETIKKWIEQGAEWKDHWGYILLPPAKPVAIHQHLL